MIRRVVSAATGGALLLALIASLAWSVRTPGFEPSVTALLVTAALAGIPADRWAAARQRRQRALLAVGQELAKNQQILADERFQFETKGPLRPMVYPRLALAAVDTALISGALAGPTEDDFVQRLFDWRSAAEEFNRRLDLTEIHLFTVRAVEQSDILRFRRAFHGPGGYFQHICQLLSSVQAEVQEAAARRTSFTG